jgi:DNA replication protein DnaC
VRAAYENIAKWVVGDPSMRCLNPETRMWEKGDLTKGIYLAGRTGCGKTWALEIFAFLASAHNIRYKAYGKDLPLALQDFRADEITTDFLAQGDTSLYTEGTKVLVINDLGTEPEETLYMGNRVNVLRQILEKRADNPARLTLITSNIPMGDKAVAARYGDRVASRLRQMCNYIEITGNDKRR